MKYVNKLLLDIIFNEIKSQINNTILVMVVKQEILSFSCAKCIFKKLVAIEQDKPIVFSIKSIGRLQRSPTENQQAILK